MPDGWLKEYRPRKNLYGSRVKGDTVYHRSPDSIVKISQTDKFLLTLFFLRCYLVFPLFLKASTSRVVLSQTFKTLSEFLQKKAKIYSTKLIPLDLS